MTKIRKRTEVTVETESQIVFRHGAPALRAWCQACGAERLMLSPDTAAKLMGVTTRHIYAEVEDGALHFNELRDGTLLFCSHSIRLNQR